MTGIYPNANGNVHNDANTLNFYEAGIMTLEKNYSGELRREIMLLRLCPKNHKTQGTSSVAGRGEGRVLKFRRISR